MKFLRPGCLLILPLLGATVSRAGDGDEPTWWSLTSPVRPAIPVVAAPEGASENPIDAFIAEKREDAGLTASPEADRRTLIRRLYFVMLGMPPMPEEVEAFVGDSNPDAWKNLVDRVLDDTRYGERWAQHWLDVIRWAETVGFETNAPRPNAWPYRDWVIASLNADKPYDRFLFEQIAGDTAGEDAALGFLAAGPANLPGQIGRDEEAMRQARQDELDEVIRTVGQAFFGLTIGCARCHDHKFDPITARDYYSMQAIFAGMTYGDRRHRGPEDDAWTAQLPKARADLARHREELEAMRKEHRLRPALESVQTEIFEPVRARAIRMKIAAAGSGAASLYEFEAWSKTENVALASGGATASASGFALANQTRHFDNLVDGSVDKRQAFPWVADKGGPAWIRVDFAKPETIEKVVWHRGSSMPADYAIEVQPPESESWIEVAHSRDRLPRIDDTRAAGQVKIAGLSDEQVAGLMAKTAAIRKGEGEVARLSAGPQVYGARFTGELQPTFLLERGDPMQRGDEVPPAVPAILGNLSLQKDAPEIDRRLGLARHLTDPAHPLTARVIVNRVWQQHFGTGLVETPSDFGKMGAKPSHPELLDWLAVGFVEKGWSLKQLHRLILNSRTFMQSSAPSSKARAIDATSRLLWRFPPRRIEAEAIRDSILAVSGKLNPKAGGVGFDFFHQQGGLSDYKSHETFSEDGWRRMVYARKIRMQAVDIFGSFDCPDAGQMKPKRTRSITPVQSLSLMNSPFAIRQAGFFAERVKAEAGNDPAVQIDRAMMVAFSRPATAVEKDRLGKLAADQGLEQVCRVLFNTSEFVFLP